MLRSRHLPVVGISLGFLLPFSTSSLAQGVIEEITVTAQKRATDEQTTPLSITAFSGEAISKANIETFGDVANATPGFSIDVFPRSQPRPWIRGIGSSNTGSAADPSVAVYVDEVYQARPGFVRFDNFDLQQIEVLKGPQGTLWGKNVVGGLVHIITNKPTDELEANLEVTAGNFGTFNAAGMVNIPVSDSWNSRLVIQRNSNEGFAENRFTGNDLFDQDSWNVRLHNQFRLSDDTELRLSAHWVDEDNSGSARNTYDGFVTGVSRDADGDVTKTTGEIDGFEDREIWGIETEFRTATPLGELSVLAAYRELDYDFNEDLDGSNYGDTLAAAIDLIGAGLDPTEALLTGDGSVIQPHRGAFENTNVSSIEVRLSDDLDNGGVWTAGAYYEYTDAEQFTFTTVLNGSCFWAASPEFAPFGAALIDGIWGFLGIPFDTSACGAIPSIGLGLADPVLNEEFQQDNETTSYAIFAELTWPLSESTSITAGGRWSYDEKDYTIGAATDLAGVTLDEPFDPIKVDDSWDQVTWRITLDHSFNDDVFGYATISTGYKAGGFQDNPSNLESARIGFDPEKVTNYELGLKSELFNRSLRANAAVFYMDYTDLQVRQIDELRSFTDNAGEAEVKGLELDVLYVPNDSISLYAKYAYLDTEFTEFLIVEDGVVVDDFSGNRLSRTPEHAYTVGGTYSVLRPFGADGDLSFSVDYSWRDDRFEDSNNLPPEIIPDYALLDGRIVYETARWSATLWGRNLLDTEYETHTAQFVVENYVSFGPPQTYGFTFRYNM